MVSKVNPSTESCSPSLLKDTAPIKDTLFQVDSVAEDFVFNDRVAQVFDDMVDRSVPFYDQVISATAKVLDGFLNHGDEVVDLGCATGTTLIQLSRLLADKGLCYTGLDTSAAMLKKAQLKAELYSKKDAFTFKQENITQINSSGTGGFILNYTLQFIRPMQRGAFVKRLFDSLRPGGVLILSEKTITHDTKLNREFIDIYHQFKRERGYSELEIANKREALENVLIPFSIAENKTMLEEAGFTSVETFFQWFNFASFIAVKPQ